MEVSKPRLGLAGLPGEGRCGSCRTNAGSTETCSISKLNYNFPRLLRDILSFSSWPGWTVLTGRGEGQVQTPRSHSVFWAPISLTATAIAVDLNSYRHRSPLTQHAKKNDLTTIGPFHWILHQKWAARFHYHFENHFRFVGFWILVKFEEYRLVNLW